jgi:cell division protein FtsA
MGAGLVLTGGGARLAGLCDLAEESLHLSARIGLAPRLDGAPESLREPAYTTLLGLLYYAQRLRQMRQGRGKPWWGKVWSLFQGETE